MAVSDGAVRYRATVAYDGTGYCGFQRQTASRPTIQGEIERAISRLASHPVSIIGAGRTDSGAHARGQVIAFDLDWSHGSEKLKRAVNANLPDAVAIVSVEEAEATFHPRYDARRRCYEYYIYNSPTRDPFNRLFYWHVRLPLDVAAMSRAATYLVGQHDFATFGHPPQGNNPVRNVFRAEWSQEADRLTFRIDANAFLYRMVRSLVGAMKAVGEGAWSEDQFLAAFKACDRARAATTAPAHGLFLVSVIYDS